MKDFVCLAMTLCVILSLSACCVKGDRGEVGAAGATGADGTNGRDGTDATPTTVVQLCPGTPSYPAHFIEVAVCLQHELYGVYSANGGFLTKLPPGRYSSSGIGSACDFTVSENCAVAP